MTKVLALLALIWPATGQAAPAAVRSIVGAEPPAVLADWQYPDRLPQRFRNHCSTEYFSGRSYCADHCGSGDQFFYCSEGSFGCCHLGRGYCDIHGILRCSP